MTISERVRKHRVKLQAEQRQRVEVSVEISLLHSVQEVAKNTKQPLHSFVEDALRAHVEDYQKLLAAERWLTDERLRLDAQPTNAPLRRQQVTEYNQQLADYKTRWLTFFKGS